MCEKLLQYVRTKYFAKISRAMKAFNKYAYGNQFEMIMRKIEKMNVMCVIPITIKTYKYNINTATIQYQYCHHCKENENLKGKGCDCKYEVGIHLSVTRTKLEE